MSLARGTGWDEKGQEVSSEKAGTEGRITEAAEDGGENTPTSPNNELPASESCDSQLRVLMTSASLGSITLGQRHAVIPTPYRVFGINSKCES